MRQWAVQMGPHRFAITARTRAEAGRVLDMRCQLMKLNRSQAIFTEVKK